MKVARGAALLALAGCAGVLGPPRARPQDAPGLRAWQAAVDGHAADAVRAFDQRLAAAPDDLLARFGRATLAFDHGEVATALDDYAAVVTAASRLLEKDGRARSPDAAWAALLAPTAAVRARTLGGDVAPGRRTRAETALLAPDAAAPLPWQARLELARLAEQVARRRGDAELLERQARARGCALEVFDAGALGPLPHLDLDATVAAPPPAEWTPLVATGCRLSLSARTGRPGAERLRAAIDVPAGTYDLILDYDGDARVAVDGAPPARHGSELTAGPRAGAWTLELAAGRHQLEIRLATQAGRAELGLLVSPRARGAAPRFVDPRDGRNAARPGTLVPATATELSMSFAALPADGAAAALRDFCLGELADARGDVEEALAIGARLATRRGFSSGLALAAAIARADPTRPSSFTRDAGRASLRAALLADDGNAQAWEDLASVELEDDHLREAIAAARSAARVAPRWWLPELVLAHALRARGLEWDADRALDRAGAKGGGPVTAPGDVPCSLLDALRRRADERRELTARARLEEAVEACDAESPVLVDRLRARGELAAAARALRAALRLAPDREDLSADLVEVLLASGARAEALAELALRVSREPRDPTLRVRLADAQAAAGQRAAALETMRQALAMRPDVTEVRRAARALGLPLPLDAHRLDGTQVIRAFEASGRRYAAPAVVVLDRTVSRVMPDGAQLTLTHEIVRVQSKDAIDRWAEVEVPAGAEVLTLRTHKPDGTTREPEEIAGKETVSAANVAIGDYVEWELLETRPASTAFLPGFLGDRFYFQSFDAPLDRTQFVIVAPAAMKLSFDRRAGAPTPRESAGDDGLRVTTFEATNVPQLFAERAAVPAIEYVPSIRAASGVTFLAWTRYVQEQLYGTARSSPALRERAHALATAAGAAPEGSRARLAAAVVKWVTENVDAVDDLRDAATLTLARGRGNRLALMLALLRELDVPARTVLARSRLVAETEAPAPVEELDDFSDSILEIALAPDRKVWIDPRLRYAAFGYLPPSLDGARTLALADGRFGVARSSGTADHRSVDVTIRLDEQGGGVAVATEELTGWPALEWAELVERFGADRARLRQDFEQRWLGVQFPGARLRDLDVDVARSSAAQRAGGAARAGVARVRYSFVSPQLAVRSDHEMRLLPTFFRSQPGRRFATEPRRSTTLVLGFDVPFHLTATLELPRAANLVEPGEGVAGRVERKGAYRFVEERHLRAGAPGGQPGAPGGDVLVLTREANLPLTRVPPAEYAGVAADLRRVDGLEQQEIRIRLRGARGVK